MSNNIATNNISTRNDFLKLIAAILMVWDHVSIIFFPEFLILRAPGRICFPIFAYYTAIGARHTKNISKYFAKLLIFAIITQPIYQALLLHGLNALFTMLYGAVVVYLWQQNKVWCISTAIFITGLAFFIPALDYGWYGIVTILLFSLTENLPTLQFLSQGVLQLVDYAMGSHPIQALSILALPLLNNKHFPFVTLPRYFFYVFYPLHLGILLMIQAIL